MRLSATLFFFDVFSVVYPMMEKMFSKITNSPSQITSNTNEVIAPNINCPITINGSGLSKEEIQTVLDGFIPKISKTV